MHEILQQTHAWIRAVRARGHWWPADARAALFAGVGALAFAWQVHAVFVAEPGDPLDVAGDRMALVSELGAGAAVGQTFEPEADRLDGVTLWFHGERDGRVHALQCELAADAGGGFAPLYRWVERAELGGGRAHTFTFPPVEPSRGRYFAFEVELPRPVEGLAVEAAAGDAVRPGFMTVDGREQWGDLRFRTRSATRYRAFVHRAHELPGPFRQPAIVISLLAIYNWAAMTFVYYMVVARNREW